jgi:hypothetical protein
MHGQYIEDKEIVGIYPRTQEVSDDIPERARAYLTQAIASLSAPDGAVMLAATSIDAMLKAKGLTEGALYARILKAEESHLITSEMAKWAHDVRLEANDSRHADEEQPHHTSASANRAVDFAIALAEFLFVLPARVARGRENSRTG